MYSSVMRIVDAVQIVLVQMKLLQAETTLQQSSRKLGSSTED